MSSADDRCPQPTESGSSPGRSRVDYVGDLDDDIGERPGRAWVRMVSIRPVLTRMPGPLAIDGPTAAAIITAPSPMCAGSTGIRRWRCSRIGPVGVTGGAVQDALVGEAGRRGCPSSANPRSTFPPNVRPDRCRCDPAHRMAQRHHSTTHPPPNSPSPDKRKQQHIPTREEQTRASEQTRPQLVH